MSCNLRPGPAALALVCVVVHVVACATPCFAQSADATIVGTIVSQTHLPVAGALVSIPRLRLSAQTNDAGAYRLIVPADRLTAADSLRVQRIGFEPRAIAIVLRPGTNTMDVVVAEYAVGLNEVVVSGTAGNQERRAQGAVVATIDAANVVQTAPITDVAQLLAGRVTGVRVSQANGSVGSTSVVRMRGASSISLSNDPLVFIDGVRTETRNIPINGGAVSTLSDLDPSTIESIEVVKGPAAATLYGADASAGVIQIITKKGTPGRRSFTQAISGEASRLRPHWTPPSNFATCGAGDVLPSSPSALCRGQAAGTVVSDNPLTREHVLRHGPGAALQWQGRGGGEGYGYFLAYGYTDESGTLPANDVRRHNARTNFTILPRADLVIDAGFGLVRDVNDQAEVGSNALGLLFAMAGSPLTVGTRTNGWFQSGLDAAAITSIENRLASTRFLPTASARYQPASWLSTRLTLGGDVGRFFYTRFFPKNDQGSYGGNTDLGQVTELRLALDSWTLDYLADARRRLGGRWSAGVSLGTQVIDRAVDSVSATGYGLATNASNTVSATAVNSAGGARTTQRFVGYLGQAQLAFADRLFLQYGVRVDRNSAFASPSQTFVLPKVGVSYVVSDEPRWRRRVPWASTVRLRAAYGTTGRAPPPGAALQTYANAPFVFNDGTQGAGVVPLNPGNPELRAERGIELEAGLDAGLFRDRLGLELTYFDKVTRDLLIQRPIPPSLGFTQNPFVNLGRVSNRGVEVAARGRLLTTPAVGLEVGARVATLRNRLVSLGGAAPLTTGVNGVNQYREGYPLGAYWSPRVRSVDVGRGVAIVSDTTEYGGSPIPTYQGAVSSDLMLFRRIRVSGLAEFRGGNTLWNATTWYREKVFSLEERVQRRASLPPEERLRLFGPYVNSRGQPVVNSAVIDDYLRDASFVRLRELSVSWAAPARVASRLRASSATVTAGARNLALWTRYGGGWDPESITFVPTSGVVFATDYYTMPEPQRFFARLNVGF
jgi:TonB-linked SusC/RagA family outer membrane protein